MKDFSFFQWTLKQAVLLHLTFADGYTVGRYIHILHNNQCEIKRHVDEVSGNKIFMFQSLVHCTKNGDEYSFVPRIIVENIFWWFPQEIN